MVASYHFSLLIGGQRYDYDYIVRYRHRWNDIGRIMLEDRGVGEWWQWSIGTQSHTYSSRQDTLEAAQAALKAVVLALPYKDRIKHRGSSKL